MNSDNNRIISVEVNIYKLQSQCWCVAWFLLFLTNAYLKELPSVTVFMYDLTYTLDYEVDSWTNLNKERLYPAPTSNCLCLTRHTFTIHTARFQVIQEAQPLSVKTEKEGATKASFFNHDFYFLSLGPDVRTSGSLV